MSSSRCAAASSWAFCRRRGCPGEGGGVVGGGGGGASGSWRRGCPGEGKGGGVTVAGAGTGTAPQGGDRGRRSRQQRGGGSAASHFTKHVQSCTWGEGNLGGGRRLGSCPAAACCYRSRRCAPSPSPGVQVPATTRTCTCCLPPAVQTLDPKACRHHDPPPACCATPPFPPPWGCRYLYHKDAHVLVGDGEAGAVAVTALARAMQARGARAGEAGRGRGTGGGHERSGNKRAGCTQSPVAVLGGCATPDCCCPRLLTHHHAPVCAACSAHAPKQLRCA